MNKVEVYKHYFEEKKESGPWTPLYGQLEHIVKL
jgi:hypothetical protein